MGKRSRVLCEENSTKGDVEGSGGGGKERERGVERRGVREKGIPRATSTFAKKCYLQWPLSVGNPPHLLTG